MPAEGLFAPRDYAVLFRAAAAVCGNTSDKIPLGSGGFWPKQVFRPSYYVFSVACGYDFHVIALNEECVQYDLREKGTADEVDDRAVGVFNELARASGVRLSGSNTEEYARFFFWAHLRNPGEVVGREEVPRILATNWNDGAAMRRLTAELEVDGFWEGPLEVSQSQGDEFRVVAFAWSFGTGIVREYNLQFESNGVIELRKTMVGKQVKGEWAPDEERFRELFGGEKEDGRR
jgi:hypothetical protein